MPFPASLGVIDCMLQVPGTDTRAWYDFMQPLFLDEASRTYAKMPVEYMFKNVPDLEPTADPVAYTVAKMDAFGIDKAMIGVQHEVSVEAIRRFPTRFFGSWHANPNRGMDEVRAIRKAKEELGIKAVTAFPSGTMPQVPIDDARWYPIYAACVDLDLPFCCTVGVPGPRIPMDPQKVERIDPVCWFFPELKFVMRHGAEPWTDLAVKLMLKYENLFYMTSAFAPRHYPQAIVDYANTRGAHKILYAGYWPMGLSLERIFEELPRVPFRDHVWPRFLRENALEVFRP
ncbi:MAG: amidohydrolase family protein [Alphaproteobacteria bacterium]|nr:amidohydrolase family protein [Alphaproteobacteria bacterium]